MSDVRPAPRAVTVLIVEDDRSLRDLYAKVLTFEGYAVVAAEDGIEALERAERETVDAVILDLVMPRMDGRSVKRKFAASEKMRNVPVILVTGHIAPDINPDDFACILHKPISIEELVKAVRNCLEQAKEKARPSYS